MSSNRVRRIQKELADMHADNQAQVSAVLAGAETDVGHLRGSFKGPEGTPYQGGEYFVDIQIPNEYPFKPPKMKFDTKVWHPNVSSQTGAICLDTLGNAWSPVLTIRSALLSLQSLLSTPEPKDPQDAEVARMLLRNPRQFEHIAREWAVKYAGAPPREGSPAAGSGPGPTSEQDYRKQLEAERIAAYHGYNPDVIDGFVEMGFDRGRVVEAFEACGVDTFGGQWFELEPRHTANITGLLLGES